METNRTLPETDENELIGTTCKSITYRKWTPCKNIYVHVVYRIDDPERIDYIRITGACKDNECGASFFESMGDTLTFCIRRIRNQHEAEAIIKNLRSHRCNKIVPNKEHITSCSDAIGRILEGVLKKPHEVSTKVV